MSTATFVPIQTTNPTAVGALVEFFRPCDHRHWIANGVEEVTFVVDHDEYWDDEVILEAIAEAWCDSVYGAGSFFRVTPL